jgi:hypothetical protein
VDRAKGIDIFNKAMEMMGLGRGAIERTNKLGETDPPEIIYKLDDEDISPKKAPAQLVAKVLFNMQGLVYSVAGSTEGRRSRRLEDLYSLNVGFDNGCLEMKFSPADSQVILSDRVIERSQTPTFLKTSKLLSVLSEKNVTDDYIKHEIEKQIEDPRSRIKILNCLKGLIPIDKKAEIGFKNLNGDTPIIKLDDVVFKARIIRLLKEEKKKYEVEVSGVICRIRDDDPPSFSVLDWSGDIVKVEMSEDKRLQILNYLADKIPIKLVGIGNKKKGIGDLDEIEPYTKIPIEYSHDIKLKSPVVAELSYDKSEEIPDYWVLGNDELGIYGVDDTVNKAIEMFKNDLYDDYIAYKDLSDIQLTDRALSLKKRLITIFEG